MRLDGPDEYQVTIQDRTAKVTSMDGAAHFTAPATAKGKPKLYVASKSGRLLYVGVTTRSMSTRLHGGLTADGSHGYHGYSWGRENHRICLQIWYLNGHDATTADLETIEAETVFLYRQQSGQWPEAQTEIHFHPSNDRHRKCAKQIVDALTVGGREVNGVKVAGCFCCKQKIPMKKPHRCPACGHVFKGNGWDGVDAHWRAKHAGLMPYEAFWNSLCDKHRG